MTVYIRQTKDFEAVTEVAELIVSGDYITQTDLFWLASTESGKAVGFCSLRPLPSENVIYLTLAGVLPSFQGLHLQRRFIHTRCAWGRRNGFRSAITYTLGNNYPSIYNLIKSGFKFYDPQYAWVGRDGVLYYIKHL